MHPGTVNLFLCFAAKRLAMENSVHPTLDRKKEAILSMKASSKAVNDPSFALLLLLVAPHSDRDYRPLLYIGHVCLARYVFQS